MKKLKERKRSEDGTAARPGSDIVPAEFCQTVADLLRNARSNSYRAVNFIMVEAYWNVGRMIVEEEQQGKERAEYGAYLIRNLSIKLSDEFVKGFDERELRRMRQFYVAYPIRGALRPELRWTHYRLSPSRKRECPHLVPHRGCRTELERPRKYWSDLKNKLSSEGYVEVSEKIGQLKMMAPDGKMRLTDCANIETMFRIIPKGCPGWRRGGRENSEGY